MNNNKDMMKLYLVFDVEYDEDLVENTRAEIWTAKSREHLWDLKNPNSAGDWVPDYEPKPSPDVPQKLFEKRHRKWEREKDKLLEEYREEKRKTIESYIELPPIFLVKTGVEPGLLVSYNVNTKQEVFSRLNKDENNKIEIL